jgi:purine-binding chemotaxis protein CheW
MPGEAMMPAAAGGGTGTPAAHAIPVASGSSQKQLVFRAGTCLCALPLDRVNEIMRVLPIKLISDVPPYVAGVCIMRGAPVPVVDVGLLVGSRATDFQRLISVRTDGRTIALAVERIHGISGFDARQFDRLPPLLRDAGADVISAIGTLDAELLLLLRVARIVPDDVLARLDVEGAAS